MSLVNHTPACHLSHPNRNIATKCSCGAWACDPDLWRIVYPGDPVAQQRAMTAATGGEA